MAKPDALGSGQEAGPQRSGDVGARLGDRLRDRREGHASQHIVRGPWSLRAELLELLDLYVDWRLQGAFGVEKQCIIRVQDSYETEPTIIFTTVFMDLVFTSGLAKVAVSGSGRLCGRTRVAVQWSSRLEMRLLW